MSEITTVIFDIGGVLVDYNEINFFKQFGYDDAMCERLVRASMRSSAWKEYDLGNLSDDEIVDLFIRNDPEIREDLIRCFQNHHGIVSRREQAIPWILRMKEKGMRVLILSNYSHRAILDCWADMDFLAEVDGGVMSFKDHVIKPYPEIYELILKRYGLKPEECVFIDDTEANLEVPRKMGMKTIHYRSSEQAHEDLERITD